MSIEADLNVDNFSYTVVDDKVYYRENSRMYPQEFALTTENRVKGLIEIRNCTRELISLQLEDYPDEFIEKTQNKLNELYDNFTKKYGLINSRANATAFSNDNSYYLLCSLEILDENGNLSRKADIFSKRTIKAHKQPKSINNSNDALIYSISEKAKVDLDFMSDVSKIPKEKLVKDLEGLIFKIPNEDKYVTADEYLSGNVREKLKDAEKANELEPIYDINIKYLKESLPKYLNASDINVRLGTTWIPKEYYQEFMEYLFEMDYYAKRKVKINYSDIRNEWYIDNKSYDNYNEKANSTYGTKILNGYKILEDTNVGGNRVLKGALFVGENASGKTQVLNAIILLLDMLLENAEQNFIIRKSLYTKGTKYSLKFTFDVDGNEKTYTSDDLFRILTNYPFKVQVYFGDNPYNGTPLPMPTTGEVDIRFTVDWPYETGDNASSIATNDAIDTYYGEAAHQFVINHPDEDSIRVQMKIVAVQNNDI